MNRNDSETKDDVDHEEDDRDIVLSFDNNSKMIAHDDENRIVSEGEFCRFKENDDRNLWGTNDAGNIQICKNKGNNSKVCCLLIYEMPCLTPNQPFHSR